MYYVAVVGLDSYLLKLHALFALSQEFQKGPLFVRGKSFWAEAHLHTYLKD